MNPPHVGTILAAALAISAGALAGQSRREGPYMATRAELEAALVRATQVADTAADTGARRRAAARRDALDRRLQHGDFAPGDRIALVVANESELTDTFTVGAARMLELPSMPPLPLGGLLRAELEGYLADTLAYYVRAPRVRARVLMRMAVLGEVERPGFYLVPVDAVVADVLMAAGGLTREARADGAQIIRGSEKLWQGERLRDALRAGVTLDEMAIEHGDQLLVPRQERVGMEATVRIVSILVALPLTIYALAQAF